MAETKIAFFLGGDKVRRGVLTTLTAVILLFSSFTFSSCKSCDKEDKGREPIGGDGNANDKPSDTSTLGGSSKISTSSGTTGDNGSGGGATEGGSPALSAEEKKEDIVRKRTAALDSIKAVKGLARVVSDEINKVPKEREFDAEKGCYAKSKSVEFDIEEEWVESIEPICSNKEGWRLPVLVMSRTYVSKDKKEDYYDDDEYTTIIGWDDVVSSSDKKIVKQQFKHWQEESRRLRKLADAHIEKIRDGTLPPPESSLQVIDGRDENGRSIWRDETPTEMAARRERFLKSWDALIEAVGKAYTDTKAVFDTVDAQNDGWTLIDILHD